MNFKWCKCITVSLLIKQPYFISFHRFFVFSAVQQWNIHQTNTRRLEMVYICASAVYNPFVPVYYSLNIGNAIDIRKLMLKYVYWLVGPANYWPELGCNICVDW